MNGIRVKQVSPSTFYIQKKILGFFWILEGFCLVKNHITDKGLSDAELALKCMKEFITEQEEKRQFPKFYH